MKRNTRLVTLVTCALLIAIHIVLVRFCSIQTTFLRISFGFIPMSLAGIMFGPWYSCAVAALADLLGATIFPTGGAFWPGFTVVAAVNGLMYGLMYQRPGSKPSRARRLIQIGLVVGLVNVVGNFVLGTLNLYVAYGSGAVANIPLRAAKAVAMIPIEFIIVTTLERVLVQPLNRQLHRT